MKSHWILAWGGGALIILHSHIFHGLMRWPWILQACYYVGITYEGVFQLLFWIEGT